VIGSLETPQGSFSATSMFGDTCRFLDHRSVILRPCVEHIAHLPLTNQNMLVATDTAVGEQFLDIEQSTRCTVQFVLRCAIPEQPPSDRYLTEVQRHDLVVIRKCE